MWRPERAVPALIQRTVYFFGLPRLLQDVARLEGFPSVESAVYDRTPRRQELIWLCTQYYSANEMSVNNKYPWVKCHKAMHHIGIKKLRRPEGVFTLYQAVTKVGYSTPPTIVAYDDPSKAINAKWSQHATSTVITQNKSSLCRIDRVNQGS